MSRIKLTERKIRYIIRQRKKGASPSKTAMEMKITPRYERMLWAKYKQTGKLPVHGTSGRPKKEVTHDAVAKVLGKYKEMPAGVVRLTERIKENDQEISYSSVYKILSAENLVTRSPTKSKKRKWVRYERRHSNSMWHVDWHMVKDLRLKGLNLVAFLDDASRCITGFGIFERATSENAALVPRKAIREFGEPIQMLSDNGRRFAAGKMGGPKSKWTATAFEKELIKHDTTLITTRPYHPQTNGELERWFRTLEDELVHFESIGEFVEFYNERRTHFSLDMKSGQTPLMAFHIKKATDKI